MVCSIGCASGEPENLLEKDPHHCPGPLKVTQATEGTQNRDKNFQPDDWMASNGILEVLFVAGKAPSHSKYIWRSCRRVEEVPSTEFG